MKEILLNDLPRYSDWPARLLDESSIPLRRTVEAVFDEYERDKYGPLLRFVDQHPELPRGAVIAALQKMSGHCQKVAGTIDEKLYAGPLGEFQALAEERLVARILRAVDALNVRSVVDLGCGWGYLLARLREHLPKHALRGGELSPSAVAVANMLGVEVDEFDFYGNGCLPLEKAESPVLVVTSYALHQLDSAADGIHLIGPYKDKIAGCLSFEPIADFYDDSILGLLRKRYQAACGYSADLLDCLNTFTETIELRDDPVPNSIGTNALLPGSFISWGFR